MDVFSRKVGHLTRAPLAIANFCIPPLRNTSARMKYECVESFKLFAYFVASARANDNFTWVVAGSFQLNEMLVSWRSERWRATQTAALNTLINLILNLLFPELASSYVWIVKCAQIIFNIFV
jgi:hypothetical protein